jgi:GT2 family glycosyltransferase
MYCVAFRCYVLDAVGLLDESYGAGMFEDDDFSRRVREAGLRVVCAEDAYVHHVGQASFAKLGRDEYERLFAKNRAYFERKWKQPWLPHKTRAGVEPPIPRL